MVVELRFLQVLLSPLTGDRVTVGLLHWDRTTLRTACAFRALPPWFAPSRADVEATVRALLEAAAQAGASSRDGPSLASLPVHEGVGASLVWSPIARANTGDAAAHFAALARELHLTEA